MKIFVKTKPGAKEDKVQKVTETNFNVWTKERAKENRANFAVIELLAKHLGISMGRIRLVAGKTSRSKVLEIE